MCQETLNAQVLPIIMIQATVLISITSNTMFKAKISVRIPPMSVNKSYQMKKIRSPEYDTYER